MTRDTTTPKVIRFHGAVYREADTFQMWHGGRITGMAEVRPGRSGHYEYGAGIYLTTAYETARRYARGGKATYIVEVQRPLRWLEQTRGDVADMIQWVRRQPGLRHKKEIIEDLETRTTQFAQGNVPLHYLVNLAVNYQVLSGRHGQALAQWLVDHEVDASLEHHGTEDWVVVFNPRVIKSVRLVSAGQVDWTTGPDFPRVQP